MITRNELLFVEGLISALKCLKVERIPFAEERFEQGASSLANFIFKEGINNKKIEQFDTLFYKRPISGSYDRLIEAMQRLNGRKISFPIHNPTYERIVIETPENDAKQILENSTCGLDEKFFIRAAREFCKGAQIQNC